MNIYNPTNIQNIITISQKLLDGAALTDIYNEDLLDKNETLIYWKDANGNILGTNLYYLKIVGFNQMQQVIGKNDFDLPWRKEQSIKYRSDDNIVRTLQCPMINIQETMATADGQNKIVLTSKFPIFSSDRKKCGVLGITTDIDEFRKLEKKLMRYLTAECRYI